jgi:hypothetical protein
MEESEHLLLRGQQDTSHPRLCRNAMQPADVLVLRFSKQKPANIARVPIMKLTRQMSPFHWIIRVDGLRLAYLNLV